MTRPASAVRSHSSAEITPLAARTRAPLEHVVLPGLEGERVIDVNLRGVFSARKQPRR